MAALRAMRMAWRSTRWLLTGTVITQVVASLGVPAQLAVTQVLVDRVVAGGEVVSLVVVLVAVTIGQRLTALAMSSLLTLGRSKPRRGRCRGTSTRRRTWTLAT